MVDACRHARMLLTHVNKKNLLPKLTHYRHGMSKVQKWLHNMQVHAQTFSIAEKQQTAQYK